MTIFYLIRHGKTQLNEQSRFQGGGIDSPLLEDSKTKASQVGVHLSELSFDFVAVSTQQRAMDTANFILKENRQLSGTLLQYFDELRELKFGQREGQLIDPEDEQTKLLRNRPDLYDPSAFGGETMDSLVARSSKILQHLHTQYPDGKVLVVAHGVLLLTLINALMGKEKANWRQGGPLLNTSISIVEKKSGTQEWSLHLFNDRSYQKEIEQ